MIRKLSTLTATAAVSALLLMGALPGTALAAHNVTIVVLDGATAADLVGGTVDAEYDVEFCVDNDGCGGGGAARNATSITVDFPSGYTIAGAATVEDDDGTAGFITLGSDGDVSVVVTTVSGDGGSITFTFTIAEIFDGTTGDQRTIFRILTGITNPGAAGETGNITISVVSPTLGGVSSSTGTVIITPPFPGTVEKELVSGPNDRDGVPIVVDIDPFDAGGILVLSPDTQRFEFKITITNDGEDGAIDGLKVFDVVGAEFDPDCDAEDGTIDDPLGTVDDCPDGPADGIAVTGGTGDCTATITPHDSGRKMDPHFILIVLDDLLAGETCEVTVWVNTDENPSSVRKGGGTGEDDADGDSREKFAPTGCDLVMEPDLFNTFTLNEGLKVFDPVSGIRLLGPVGSLQLTCNFPD